MSNPDKTSTMPGIPTLIVSLFFLSGGIAHLVATDFFILAMPSYLGYHRELVLISGVLELLGALTLMLPQTRALAGYGLIALSIAVFPANIHMALNSGQYPDIPEVLLYLRLPLQLCIIGFIWWALAPTRLPPTTTPA